MRTIRNIVTLGLVGILLYGCNDSDPELDPRERAHDAFWQAFTSQSYDEAGHVAEQLEDVHAKYPDDVATTLLLGHVNLWRLSESGRQASPDYAALPAFGAAAHKSFGEVMARSPEDNRVFGWLGSLAIGNGGALGDSAMVQTGYSLVDAGAVRYPEFNLFVRALVLGSEPRESAKFNAAIDAMWSNVDICAGAPVDREHPDFSTLLGRVAGGRIDPACADSQLAAHNFEGFFLYFGDLLTKASRNNVARDVYSVALKIPNAAHWPYRAALDDRLAQVDERSARWRNDDPKDDPRLVAQEPFNCASCHATHPSEPLPKWTPRVKSNGTSTGAPSAATRSWW